VFTSAESPVATHHCFDSCNLEPRTFTFTIYLGIAAVALPLDFKENHSDSKNLRLTAENHCFSLLLTTRILVALRDCHKISVSIFLQNVYAGAND
jgi:hypothetical protein